MSSERHPADGERPAFYALTPGGWRDYWTLLHPPYTIWHLSYVVMGASLAPVVNVRWLVETLLAFFLAMGIAAHALDELHGRPLGTRIPDAVLWALAAIGLAGAVALGIDGAREVSPWIWAFIAAGVFLVLAYNLELFGGVDPLRPVVRSGVGGVPRPHGVLRADGAHRTGGRSRWRPRARPSLRRNGSCRRPSDGSDATSRRSRGRSRRATATSSRSTPATLRSAPERALRWMSLAMPLLALGDAVAEAAGARPPPVIVFATSSLDRPPRRRTSATHAIANSVSNNSNVDTDATSGRARCGRR